MLMISAPTLKMTWRSGTLLRVDNRHWVTPPRPATIIVWSGPSSTSDMKSVKYDIESVALPLTSGRCTFEAEINAEAPSSATNRSGWSIERCGSRRARMRNAPPMTAPTYTASIRGDVHTRAIAAHAPLAANSVADACERACADIEAVKVCRGRASEAVHGMAVQNRRRQARVDVDSRAGRALTGAASRPIGGWLGSVLVVGAGAITVQRNMAASSFGKAMFRMLR